MSRKRQDIINDFLENPQKLLLKKPFLRGSRSITINDSSDGSDIKTNFRKEAQLPNISKIVVSQERFAKELDPYSHLLKLSNCSRILTTCNQLLCQSFLE